MRAGRSGVWKKRAGGSRHEPPERGAVLGSVRNCTSLVSAAYCFGDVAGPERRRSTLPPLRGSVPRWHNGPSVDCVESSRPFRRRTACGFFRWKDAQSGQATALMEHQFEAAIGVMEHAAFCVIRPHRDRLGVHGGRITTHKGDTFTRERVARERRAERLSSDDD